MHALNACLKICFHTRDEFEKHTRIFHSAKLPRRLIEQFFPRKFYKKDNISDGGLFSWILMDIKTVANGIH